MPAWILFYTSQLGVHRCGSIVAHLSFEYGFLLSLKLSLMHCDESNFHETETLEQKRCFAVAFSVLRYVPRFYHIENVRQVLSSDLGAGRQKRTCVLRSQTRKQLTMTAATAPNPRRLRTRAEVPKFLQETRWAHRFVLFE